MSDNAKVIHVGPGEGNAFSAVGDVYRVLAAGEQTITAKAGTFVQGPRGIPHSFKNNGKLPARMLVYITPAGFENFVKEFAQPVASFDSPAIPVNQDEINKLIAAAPK